ncbi:hypothetical protein LNK15_05885 [Jeotgalicoccus huakuii]|nr:hypothetical protein [Jeotgalicoccus huakuii]
MLAFIIIGVLVFSLTFLGKSYKIKLQEKYQKPWSKVLNYIRWIALATAFAGVMYTPGAQMLLISGWLLVFSLLIYVTSLFMIYYKNKKAI